MENLTELVTRAAQGEAAAYEALVLRFQDMAVGYGYALLGDRQSAEDAAQEAFIAAYHELRTLREPAAFPGWFRRILFKHADRQRRQRPTVALTEAFDLPSTAPDPAETAERREFQATVMNAIEALPGHSREVVMLFYMAEYSLREISAFLEIPLGTVKTRLYTARQQLKARMITIMHDTFSDQRPSRNDEFANRVIRLFHATIEGDTAAVRALLEHDARLARANAMVGSSLWKSPAPALHVAVMHGRKDIVDLLLAHGADIDEPDEQWKFTPLHQALDMGFLPDYAALGMVDYLLARGAQKDLFACLWMEDYDRAKTLVEQTPALVHALGPGNLPPLCYAGTPEMADFLVEHGADMAQRIPCRFDEQTPLRWLSLYDHNLLRHLLRRAGISLDAFLYCTFGDQDQVMALLAGDPRLLAGRTGPDHVLEPDLTLLHLAVQHGHIEIARRLLDHGADVNATAPAVLNMTPLHFAVWRGRTEKGGAMPNAEELLTSPGVLHMPTPIIRLLLEHGADVSLRDSVEQRTPLGWAEMDHDDEVDRRDAAALLREFGAN